MSLPFVRASYKRLSITRLHASQPSKWTGTRFNSSQVYCLSRLYTVPNLQHFFLQRPSTPSSTYAEVTHPDGSSSSSALPESVQKELEKAARYILPVYARPPLVLERGKGVYVWDTQGRKYLDFTAGVAVNALGHADPEFVQVNIFGYC